MKHFLSFYNISLIVIVLTVVACQSPGGDVTGSEFMPDMAHSIAYEANTSNYYYNNTWSSKEEYEKFAQPRLPVAGTIPHGNTTEVYPYGDTEEERTRAIAGLLKNPYPITDAGLANGKELYNTFCAICHGEKADGNGYLVRDGGAYPVQPANFLLDEHLNASNGRYYHAIMHGKNLMGAYKDKINVEERWQVIHYIRSLQAKEKQLQYNQIENTFNASFGSPAGEVAIEETHHHQGEAHDDHGHSGEVDAGHDVHGSHHGSDQSHGDHKEGGHDDESPEMHHGEDHKDAHPNGKFDNSHESPGEEGEGSGEKKDDPGQQ